MWAKKLFFKAFSFLPGPFQGGHFFGGVIYLAALDLGNLGPIALMDNLRPVLRLGDLPGGVIT
jgi:hypothetical protein